MKQPEMLFIDRQSKISFAWTVVHEESGDAGTPLHAQTKASKIKSQDLERFNCSGPPIAACFNTDLKSLASESDGTFGTVADQLADDSREFLRYCTEGLRLLVLEPTQAFPYLLQLFIQLP